MKKKLWIGIIALLIILAVLLLLQKYNAKAGSEEKFIATVLEISESSVLVEPMEDEPERSSSDKIFLGIADLEELEIEVGSIVQITYTGGIMETYPAQIEAVSWKLWTDLRDLQYTENWLDKTTAEKYDNNLFDHITITRIYENCFFAKTVIPMPYEIKLNGMLSDEWCVGDQIICTYDNIYYDSNSNRVEVDMLTVETSNWQPDPEMAYKPVIYLYPEKETNVSVKLSIDGELTCTYPKYEEGWAVNASPDGVLKDHVGKTYNYLYWEGILNTQYDFTKGFCVKGKETASFLECALDQLGLTSREANEFIVYWLPLMEKNPYNIISFQGQPYTDAAELTVLPCPDTTIRIFMVWYASEQYLDIDNQVLDAPERTGFTVVEWGGTEIKK